MSEFLAAAGRVFAQFWKSRLVAKLRSPDGVNVKRTAIAKGRKSLAKMYPEAAALARRLHRKRKARMSLRAIAAELEVHGYLNERGCPFNPKSVASMLRQTSRRARRRKNEKRQVPDERSNVHRST